MFSKNSIFQIQIFYKFKFKKNAKNIQFFSRSQQMNALLETLHYHPRSNTPWKLRKLRNSMIRPIRGRNLLVMNISIRNALTYRLFPLETMIKIVMSKEKREFIALVMIISCINSFNSSFSLFFSLSLFLFLKQSRLSSKRKYHRQKRRLSEILTS